MPDITKCSGKINEKTKCPLRKTCYRQTSEPSFMQSYMQMAYNDETRTCALYWEIKEDKKQAGSK